MYFIDFTPRRCLYSPSSLSLSFILVSNCAICFMLNKQSMIVWHICISAYYPAVPPVHLPPYELATPLFVYSINLTMENAQLSMSGISKLLRHAITRGTGVSTSTGLLCVPRRATRSQHNFHRPSLWRFLPHL